VRQELVFALAVIAIVAGVSTPLQLE
jgi:hypothetical protein